MIPEQNARSRPLRVLQVSRWLCASGGGGIQTYIAALAHALRERSVSLRYAALLHGSVPTFADAAHLGTQKRAKWRNAVSLRRWLSHALEDTDLVHIHGVTDWHFLTAASACRARNIPYVVTLHGGLFGAASSQGWARRIKTRLCLHTHGHRLIGGASAAIASTPKEARLCRQLDDTLEVFLCPPGVAVPESPAALPRLPSASGYLDIVFVGRIEPVKSLPTLIRALATLRDRGFECRLELVGSGNPSHTRELRALAAKLGVTDALTWHGYLAGRHKFEVIRRAHVLAMPSLSENFGFAVVEAMAQGRPVVVSDGVGLAETVRQHDVGEVFPVGDVDALVRALARFADGEVLARRAAGAYRLAVQEFSFEQSGLALESAYSRLAFK